MAYNAENAIRILQGRLQPDKPRLFVQADITVRQLQMVAYYLNLFFFFAM
jgi:hypothetical protein